MKTVKGCLIFLSVLQLVLGCSKQESKVTGRIDPVTIGVRVAALQNGKIVSETEAGTQDGTFTLHLPPGAYDISVSVPGSPYPLMFQAVAVHEGTVTDLSRIDLPAQAGQKGALSGRIIFPNRGATLSLYSDGKERASAGTDDEGNYQFREVPAGSYILKANSTGYAPESFPVTVPADGTATEDFGLFYQSALNEVDWSAGKIRVTGFGAAPANAPTQTIRKEMAKRAALADAQRKLIKTLSEIKIGPDKSLKSGLGEKKFVQSIQGFVKGYSVVQEHERENGAIEVEVELPLTGAVGLSRSLMR
jgi:hypothetical protein